MHIIFECSLSIPYGVLMVCGMIQRWRWQG